MITNSHAIISTPYKVHALAHVSYAPQSGYERITHSDP